MPSLAEEHPSATHFLIVATSGGTNKENPVCRYVAQLEATNGNPELKAPVTVTHPGRALLEATICAAGRVPEDSHLHVIGKIDYVLAELDTNMAERIRSGYKNSKRKPLQDADLYQKLDELIRDRRLKLSAGRPQFDTANQRYDAVDDMAKVITGREKSGDPEKWIFNNTLAEVEVPLPSVEIGEPSDAEPKGSATSAVPDFPADWQWAISNNIPPPVNPPPKRRARRKP